MDYHVEVCASGRSLFLVFGHHPICVIQRICDYPQYASCYGEPVFPNRIAKRGYDHQTSPEPGDLIRCEWGSYKDSCKETANRSKEVFPGYVVIWTTTALVKPLFIQLHTIAIRSQYLISRSDAYHCLMIIIQNPLFLSFDSLIV